MNCIDTDAVCTNFIKYDYRYVGCATGTCAITSSPWLSTGFGCVLGSLLYTVLRPGRGKRQDGDRAE